MSGFPEAPRRRSRFSDHTCYPGRSQKQDYLYVQIYLCLYSYALILHSFQLGVSWYQPSNEDNLLLSSAGEDGSVCIWKANDLSLLFEQNAHQVMTQF